MNPDTNKFEQLEQVEALRKLVDEAKRKDTIRAAEQLNQLVRPNGEPVPKHWSIFRIDENYVINGYTFRCMYIGETSILFEPVGPVLIEKGEEK